MVNNQDVFPYQQTAETVAQLAAIVEHSDDAIISKTLDGIITSWNPAAGRLYGYTASEAIGRPITKIIPGDRLHEWQAMIVRLRQGENIHHFETIHLRKDGALVAVSVTLSPIKDVSGQIAGVSAIVRDISNRQQREEAMRRSEERLQIIAEVSADAIYDWDINSGITRWNHGMRTLFGYPVDDEQAHLWWQMQVHPEDRPRTLDSLQSALANRDRFWVCEYRYRRADDTYAHVLDRGQLIYDEQERPLRMIGAMIDITDRVLLAEAQTRAALEERQRLARDLHDSVTQSLYSLTLLAEAARRWAAAGDAEQVQTHLGRLGETAQQSLKEMRLLVYELRPAALEKEGLVGALQQRLDAVEKRAGVNARLLVDGLLNLPPATEESFYRIAQEALNNALKHTAATAVTVKLQTTPEGVALEIVDNGQGVNPKRVQDKGGMGLNNIRERAERLGGRAEIESQPGAGMSVRVFIPGEEAP